MSTNMEIKNPYIQYMYSYPHKTAYLPLHGVSLIPYLERMDGSKNSLYFHIPFCQYKCGYCNLFSVASADTVLMERYVDAMERQAAEISSYLPDNVEFSDLTFGGGTPLILPENLLERLFGMAKEYFAFMPDNGKPIIVETSPNQTTEAKLHLLKESGVSRISIGIQSFQEGELKALHRFHSASQADVALQLIQKIGFPSVNIDMIYGIPGQTEDSFLSSLGLAVSYEPEELFLYPLYVKFGTALWKEGIRPLENRLSLYKAAREWLENKGYDAVSMRRFIHKMDGESRKKNNMEINRANICQNTEVSLCGFGNTLSVGCGGRSYLGNLHVCSPYEVGQAECQKQIEQYVNQKSFLEAEYGFFLESGEQKRRYVMKHILFGNGILREDYQKRFEKEILQEFPLFLQWEKEGYAEILPDRIFLTKEGFTFSDYLGPQLISPKVARQMEQWQENKKM